MFKVLIKYLQVCHICTSNCMFLEQFGINSQVIFQKHDKFPYVFEN